MRSYGIESHDIGVIAPYRAQLKLIRTKLAKMSNVNVSPSSQQSQMSQQQEKQEKQDKQKKQEREGGNSIILDTIDRFQGSDCDIIIISFVHRASDDHLGSILYDWKRINVALTRAKCKLILIGSKTALYRSNLNIHKKLIDIVTNKKWIVNVENLS